ncbi:PREDICTED: uncharacterized protein LOC107074702 [Polistes dominula]|uniref:Uncharacterized protein LOC107074702 n=1 Tax=Polistes dominula TaxID=743375 RepID=A0ABM1JHB7_POLDO|nr:PREDICTED: uncharacterized protein LOC107074702 [Polistes dominula]XP_015191855.1 PREDICTED: uncharacterized protein LOC107074702 [Polistes dominula]
MMYLYIGLIICLIIIPSEIQSKFDDIQSNNVAELTSQLTIQRTENFKRILNYVHNSKEFQPFMVSLLLFDTKSYILESLLHQIAIDFIQGYRINANDFVTKCTWRDQFQLTWILPIDDLRQLQHFLHEKLWKPNNQYLIIFLGEEEISRKTWKTIFQELWFKFHVYRILVTSIIDHFQCFLNYHPFESIPNGYGKVHKLCFDDFEEYNTRNQTNSFSSVLSENINLFETFENINGYPIKVTVFPSMMMNINVDENNVIRYTKLDAKVMSTLENSMNTNFIVTVLYKMDDVDPFHESLRNIEDNKSELVLTSLFIKIYNDSFLYEFTVGIEVDKLCFIAPTRGYLPKSYMPFLPFTKELWILLIFYNIFVTIFWVILKYLSYSIRNDKPITCPLSKDLWDIRKEKLSNVISKRNDYSRSINKEKSPPEIHPYVIGCTELMILFCYPFERAYTPALRIFLCGSLLFGLVIAGLYNNWLMWTLSKPLRYPEINTIEDVADSNYTIVTKYLNLKEDTFIGDDPLDTKLRSKISVLNSDKPTNYFVAFDRSFIALGRFTSIKLENYSVYYDDDGNKLIHVVEECPVTYTLSYVIKLNSPYTERINTLLLRMQQFGFINFWYEEMTHPLFVEDAKMKLQLSERKKKLTLEHYSLTFIGLFIGLIGCFLVFLAEIHYARCRRC